MNIAKTTLAPLLLVTLPFSEYALAQNKNQHNQQQPEKPNLAKTVGSIFDLMLFPTKIMVDAGLRSNPLTKRHYEPNSLVEQPWTTNNKMYSKPPQNQYQHLQQPQRRRFFRRR